MYLKHPTTQFRVGASTHSSYLSCVRLTACMFYSRIQQSHCQTDVRLLRRGRIHRQFHLRRSAPSRRCEFTGRSERAQASNRIGRTARSVIIMSLLTILPCEKDYNRKGQQSRVSSTNSLKSTGSVTRSIIITFVKMTLTNQIPVKMGRALADHRMVQMAPAFCLVGTTTSESGRIAYFANLQMSSFGTIHLTLLQVSKL